MNSDCAEEHLLWNTHELSSISRAEKADKAKTLKSLIYSVRVRIFLVLVVFVQKDCKLYLCGESSFVAFCSIIWSYYRLYGFWMKVFGYFPQHR